MVVAVTVIVSKEHTSANLADQFTNTMAAPKREGILDNFTYLEANWSMWVLYPSESLPKAMGHLNRKEPN